MVNKDGSISWIGYVNKEYRTIIEGVIKGKTYRVKTTSAGAGSKVWEALDTVTNVETKASKTMTRREWLNYFNKYL